MMNRRFNEGSSVSRRCIGLPIISSAPAAVSVLQLQIKFGQIACLRFVSFPNVSVVTWFHKYRTGFHRSDSAFGESFQISILIDDTYAIQLKFFRQDFDRETTGTIVYSLLFFITLVYFIFYNYLIT